MQVEIRIKGQIDRKWSDWLGGVTVIPTTDGETLLTGQVNDQSALYGLLSSLSRLGLQLVSVSCTSPIREIRDEEVPSR
jgi:hypothetical protein